jgi:hypothetical protein
MRPSDPGAAHPIASTGERLRAAGADVVTGG